MTNSIVILGRVVTVTIERLDEGLDISLFGGDKTHVGAGTIADRRELHTISRQGHKEAVLTEEWAGAFQEKCNCPVCVRAGIHINDASKKEISAILEACNRLLKETLEMM